MWTYEKALSVVRAYVDVSTDATGVVLEEQTIDRPYGWVFFYQSRAYLESGEFLHMFVGNAPLIFNRVTGEYRITGTARPIDEYLAEYESDLPRAWLEMKPQLRRRPENIEPFPAADVRAVDAAAAQVER